MAGGGGRWLRPGYNACSPETVAACDAYGICLAQPSGDDEFNFESITLTSNSWKYKKEFHRDLIIRDRNNPSINIWETANGGMNTGMMSELINITKTWEPTKDYEVQLANNIVSEWYNNKTNGKAFAFANWYLAETQGEERNFLCLEQLSEREFVNQRSEPGGENTRFLLPEVFLDQSYLGQWDD